MRCVARGLSVCRRGLSWCHSPLRLLEELDRVILVDFHDSFFGGWLNDVPKACALAFALATLCRNRFDTHAVKLLDGILDLVFGSTPVNEEGEMIDR